MKPRRKYFVSCLTLSAFLVCSGCFFHWSANRRQRLALSRRIDALESAFSSMQTVRAENDSSADTNERSESVAGLPMSPVADLPPPRILGNGRLRGWLYTDVRYADGYTARYYCRTNATPLQVRQFVADLSADAREHQHRIYSPARDDMGAYHPSF